ncbi:hypothetical protein ACFLYR_08490 [Chloroflexota bacterium]
MKKWLMVVMALVITLSSLISSCSSPSKPKLEPALKPEIESEVILYDSAGGRLNSSDLQVQTAFVGGIPLVYVSDPQNRYLPAVVPISLSKEREISVLLTDYEEKWDTFPLGLVDIDVSSLPLVTRDIPISDLSKQIRSETVTLLLLTKGGIGFITINSQFLSMKQFIHNS